MHADTDWITHAKCRDMDPEKFDLSNMRDKYGISNAHEVAAARERIAAELCEGCPVVAQCALDAAEPVSVGMVRAGVWVPTVTDGSKIAADARQTFRRIAAPLTAEVPA